MSGSTILVCDIEGKRGGLSAIGFQLSAADAGVRAFGFWLTVSGDGGVYYIVAALASRVLALTGVLTVATGLIAISEPPAPPMLMSVCELSRDLPRFRNEIVAVRGIYYNGLQQECGKCAIGPWPSFVEVQGGSDAEWLALDSALLQVEADAKRTGRRFEIWVTVVGRLRTAATRSPLGPCDRIAWGGYGHLNAFPAEIIVESIRDVEVRVNRNSRYDYAHMYHGPA